MYDPFLIKPWKEPEASLAEKVWRFHDLASRGADEEAITSLRMELERDFAAYPESVGHLRSIASTPLSSFKNATAGFDEWVNHYAVSVGRLLAALGGVNRVWQLTNVDDLSRGFFYARRILLYPVEHAAGESLLDWNSDGLEGSGRLPSKLLWRESIRAKNLLADGVALARDLPRGQRVELKRSVLTVLEYLRVAEKSGFDQSLPDYKLGIHNRMEIELLARFGRATFKS